MQYVSSTNLRMLLTCVRVLERLRSGKTSESGSRLILVSTAILIAAILSVPVGATIGIIGAADAADGETVLRMGFMQGVDTLNPLIGLNDASYVFYGLVYDALNCVGNDFTVDENLATSWWPVPETDPQLVQTGEPFYSVWQYEISRNATWHDKEPLTAEDVVFTLNLNADNYDSMWAYQPYTYWMHYAEKIGDYTVRIHFYDRLTGEAFPAVYAYLLAIPILPKHKLQSISPYDIAFNWNGVFGGEKYPIVGTGPFMAPKGIYDEWLGGDYLTLVKNPDYHWKAERGWEIHFDKIRMYFYDDATAMRLALEGGDIDVAKFPPHEYKEVDRAVSSGELKGFVTYDGLTVTQYWTEVAFNMANDGPNPARLDPAVRHALAMATNKSHIVQNFYMGYGEVGTTLVSPIDPVWHYEPTADELFEFDLDAARALLESAGYIDIDHDGIREATDQSLAVQQNWVSELTELKFEMMTRREFPEEKDIAMYLDQVWNEVGVDLEIEQMNEATMATIAYTYTYDTMIYFWSDDPDPNFMLFCMSEKAWDGWNDNMYTSPEYEANYTNSVKEADHDKRKEYVDNCQRIHYRDASYIILAYPYQTYAWSNETFSGWGDWEAHPGRSVDAFWTGNPLYFDLIPLKTGGRSTTLYFAIGLGAIAVVAVGAILAFRKMSKKKGFEED